MTTSIRIAHPINWHGVWLQPGTVVDAADDDARSLISSGYAAPSTQPPSVDQQAAVRQSLLDILGPGLTLPSTKRVSAPFGAVTNIFAAAAFADFAIRLPVRLPVDTTRWRLRLTNRNNATGVALTTPWNITGVWHGKPAALTTGRLNGAWAAAPTQVASGGAVPTDGSDLVTPWVTDSARQFAADRTAMLGIPAYCNSATGTGVGATGCQVAFRNGVAGANADIANPSASNYAAFGMVFDARIEYEYVGSNPVGLFVGDSLTEGYTGTGTYPFMWESFPGAYGLQHKTPNVNLGIFGTDPTPFLSSTAFGFSRVDLATTVPDYAVVELGSNSLAPPINASASGVQTALEAVFTAIRDLGIQRIYAANIAPRGFSGSNETNRNTVNAWLAGLPTQIDGLADFDILLRDPSTPSSLLGIYDSGDHAHPSPRGYQRLAAALHAA